MAKRKLNRDRLEVDENILKLMQYGEQIKPIPNCNNYYVTTFGRVFSNKYLVQYKTLEGQEYYYVVWKELKQRVTNGYYCVNITNNNGDRKREYIHKLVYETFNNFVDTTTLKIVHRDKNKLNNKVGNLAVTWRKKTDYQAHKNYAYRVKMQQIV